jgi:hypothetical protein
VVHPATSFQRTFQTATPALRALPGPDAPMGNAWMLPVDGIPVEDAAYKGLSATLTRWNASQCPAEADALRVRPVTRVETGASTKKTNADENRTAIRESDAVGGNASERPPKWPNALKIRNAQAARYAREDNAFESLSALLLRNAAEAKNAKKENALHPRPMKNQAR